MRWMFSAEAPGSEVPATDFDRSALNSATAGDGGGAARDGGEKASSRLRSSASGPPAKGSGPPGGASFGPLEGASPRSGEEGGAAKGFFPGPESGPSRVNPRGPDGGGAKGSSTVVDWGAPMARVPGPGPRTGGGGGGRTGGGGAGRPLEEATGASAAGRITVRAPSGFSSRTRA